MSSNGNGENKADEDTEVLWKKIKEIQKKKEQMKLEKEKELEEAEKQKQEAAAERARLLEEQQQSGVPKEEKQGYEIFVGKLHPSVNKEKLMKHFECCGQITRCTILEDHYNHRSKGYAYLTFAEKSGADNALKLNDSLLESQTIEVKEKRDNKPGMNKRFARRNRRRFRRQ